MRALLKASGVIDAINDRFGVIANWLVLIACLVSAGNAFVRYGLNALLKLHQSFPFAAGLETFIVAYGNNANAWLEVQWYMFAGMVLLGARLHAQGQRACPRRSHLRHRSPSARACWIDILGVIFFLLPICVILIYFTWPWFVESWRIERELRRTPAA